ncbi:p-hydroxybenzoic acid efflux pump subunit AaeA [invertebrate metagenome]|uniref:p-hydroxybenzoic acid efflux pump subunit AaeA n=1 Tax=invertebrate metagenome TaxID=1711999 RepID=A0A2H9TB00_9ZZZZ
MLSRYVTRQIILSVCILSVSGLLVAILLMLDKTPEKRSEPSSLPLVRFQSLQQESVTVKLQSQGIVRPVIETTLVAEVAGIVTEVSDLFFKGVPFKKGDVLVRLDDSDYQVARYKAAAELAASQARLAEEQARAYAEERNWVASGKSLSKAPDLLLRKPFIAEMKAQVEAARAQLQKTRRDIEKTVIQAPYDGMVRDRGVSLGRFVTVGTSLGSVFSTSRLEVRVPVKPSELLLMDSSSSEENYYRSSARVIQRLGSQSFEWQGQVMRVEGVVDDRSHMHYAVISVDNPYDVASTEIPPLKEGTFVEIVITGKTISNVYRLPRSALFGSGQVMILDHGHHLWVRGVNVVYSTEDSVFITATPSLQEGERVCITPPDNPVDGMPVSVVPESPGLPKAAADKNTSAQGTEL